MTVTTAAGAASRIGLADLAEPADLRCLTVEQLTGLAAEIREFVVQEVSRTGGHLGPNLGAVELTLALHRVFDSPRDVILFDIGHQAYVHKVITGRRLGFRTLRQRGGLSGYLCRAESSHDVIENSHASTVLAYADGIGRAMRLRGELDRWVVAVVGDGALTGGMCWEALNNIATAGHDRLVVVLNDNGRSYAPTVGGLGAHLAALRRRQQPDPAAVTVFDNLGVEYLGPVDGHDVAAVETALRQARELRRPVIVHCVTVKGFGYRPAETDEADCLHGVGRIDPATGHPAVTSKPTWTGVFGEEIAKLGAERPDLVCLTAAMLRPVGLDRFAARFADRVFDVGIAEQHAVCCAAGLATAGLHPVVCVYATFLNRAFDQVLLDVAMHGLPVTFVLDRAGITGPDGPSHHGMWDMSILSGVPGLRIAAPRDPARLRELLREAVAVDDAPTVVRFPKAEAGGDVDAVERVGNVDVLRRDRTAPADVLLVAAGAMAGRCLDAAEQLVGHGLGVTVADPRWIAPTTPALLRLAGQHRWVITVEDGLRTGGAGTLLSQACADAGIVTPVRNLGLPRAFAEHGGRDELLAECGLTGPGIARSTLRITAGASPD